MTKLGAVGGAFVTLAALIASCSGDERRVAHDSDAGAAGEAGASGPGGTGSGGSSSSPAGAGGVPTPAGGESASGGAAAGMGGALNASGMGGSGDVGGAPTVPSAGAGGALDCPATPAAETHSCGLVVELWLPSFTTADRTIHFNVSQLEPPIVGGTIRVQFQGLDGADCQELPVQVSDGDATVVLPTQVVPAAFELDIFTFTLIDECGGTHTYDPNGVVCNTLHGTGEPGVWNLGCEVRGEPCPGQCQ